MGGNEDKEKYKVGRKERERRKGDDKRLQGE